MKATYIKFAYVGEKEEKLIPKLGSFGAACFDLVSNKDINIEPGEVVLVPTGIRIELPRYHEGQVRPRSGLALKHGITVLNSPGTVDEDYRGEIGVILINRGKLTFHINRFDRIAQLAIRPTGCFFEPMQTIPEEIEFVEVEEEVLSQSARGGRGFGSTGVGTTKEAGIGIDGNGNIHTEGKRVLTKMPSEISIKRDEPKQTTLF